MTVTGCTVGENLDRVTWNPNQKVISSAKSPITSTGGVVGLKGTLAPEGAIAELLHEDARPRFESGESNLPSWIGAKETFLWATSDPERTSGWRGAVIILAESVMAPIVDENAREERFLSTKAATISFLVRRMLDDKDTCPKVTPFSLFPTPRIRSTLPCVWPPKPSD